MARLVTFPSPGEAALRAEAEDFDGGSDEARALADEMGRIMREGGGIGLAAPQISSALRVIVVSDTILPGGNSGNFEAMLNPNLVWASEEEEVQIEGCLSLPGRFGLVLRPKWCVVGYQQYGDNGHLKNITMECHGLLARCVQHEVDHLDGVLISDHWLYEVQPEGRG